MLLSRYFGRQCVRLMRNFVVVFLLFIVVSIFWSNKTNDVQHVAISNQLDDFNKMGMIVAEEIADADRYQMDTAVVKDEYQIAIESNKSNEISGNKANLFR